MSPPKPRCHAKATFIQRRRLALSMSVVAFMASSPLSAAGQRSGQIGFSLGVAKGVGDTNSMVEAGPWVQLYSFVVASPHWNVGLGLYYHHMGGKEVEPDAVLPPYARYPDLHRTGLDLICKWEVRRGALEPFFSVAGGPEWVKQSGINVGKAEDWAAGLEIQVGTSIWVWPTASPTLDIRYRRLFFYDLAPDGESTQFMAVGVGMRIALH